MEVTSTYRNSVWQNCGQSHYSYFQESEELQINITWGIIQLANEVRFEETDNDTMIIVMKYCYIMEKA